MPDENRQKGDPNDLATWFPPLWVAGLPVPDTTIIKARCGDLFGLLDGEEPEGWDKFMRGLREAVEATGLPCFLRTGHGSGKHNWKRTCYVERVTNLERHVAELVEWSALADIVSLPVDTWVVRSLIPTAPLFVCRGYGDFPVTREFRLFVTVGPKATWVDHIQPYWPPEAVGQGRPLDPDWEAKLAVASRFSNSEQARFVELARAAANAQEREGRWSVDLLQDRDGEWWVTDMADGDRSFRWSP